MTPDMDLVVLFVLLTSTYEDPEALHNFHTLKNSEVRGGNGIIEPSQFVFA